MANTMQSLMRPGVLLVCGLVVLSCNREVAPDDSAPYEFTDSVWADVQPVEGQDSRVLMIVRRWVELQDRFVYERHLESFCESEEAKSALAHFVGELQASVENMESEKGELADSPWMYQGLWRIADAMARCEWDREVDVSAIAVLAEHVMKKGNTRELLFTSFIPETLVNNALLVWDAGAVSAIGVEEIASSYERAYDELRVVGSWTEPEFSEFRKIIKPFVVDVMSSTQCVDCLVKALADTEEALIEAGLERWTGHPAFEMRLLKKVIENLGPYVQFHPCDSCSSQ